MPRAMTPDEYAAGLLSEPPEAVPAFMLREMIVLAESRVDRVAAALVAHVDLDRPPPAMIVANLWLRTLFEHTPYPPAPSMFGSALLAQVAMAPEEIAKIARHHSAETPEQVLRGMGRPRALEIEGLADAMQDVLAFARLTEPMVRHLAAVARAALPLTEGMGAARTALAQATGGVAIRWTETATPQTADVARDAAIDLFALTITHLPANSLLWASNGVTIAVQLLDRYRARRDRTDLYRAEAYCASAPAHLPDAGQRAGAYCLWGEILLAQHEETMDPAKAEAASEEFHEALMCAPPVSPLLPLIYDGARRASRARKGVQ
jgi:hypothetical protein